MIVNLLFPQCEEFYDCLNDCWFLKRDLLHEVIIFNDAFSAARIIYTALETGKLGKERSCLCQSTTQSFTWRNWGRQSKALVRIFIRLTLLASSLTGLMRYIGTVTDRHTWRAAPSSQSKRLLRKANVFHAIPSSCRTLLQSIPRNNVQLFTSRKDPLLQNPYIYFGHCSCNLDPYMS
jgi:hypothetical protein